ncbi:MAG: 1-phosphofructokinase family hexose kinase [Myxococcales bacterium]
METVVTLTLNPAVDLNTTVDAMLPEHKLRCRDSQYDPGGGGLNVARVVQALGGEAIAAWTRGGPTGEMLHALLDAEKLRHAPLSIAQPTRESVTVTEASTNAQYRFVLEGPTLSAAEAERMERYVAELAPTPDYLVLSGSLPPGLPDDFYVRLARRAGGRTRVIVDTSGAALGALKGSRVFLIKPNLRELSLLVKRELETLAEVVQAARSLVYEGTSEAVFVSMGGRGALLVTRDRHDAIMAPPVKPASRVGAGDSSVGGMVAALTRGMDLSQAARFGVAAGSACVMTPGTRLCTRADTERLFRSMGDPS